MPSGGHARSGPAPDPNALRRDRDKPGEWIDLPAEGRKGRTPAWPLSKPTARETVLWKREWRRPQAVMWERNGQELEVALLVRAVVVAEDPRATAADRNAVQRKLSDLGLTVPGLRANRWRIVSDEVASKAHQRRAEPTAKAPSAKERLSVIQGGGA